MDKNLQNIEDLFKKGLEGNEESPSENVWNNIDQSLEKENSLKFRKKYYSLKRATAILLVVLALLSIYVLKNESQKQIEKQKNENVAKEDNILKKEKTPQRNNSTGTINKKQQERNTSLSTKKGKSKSTDVAANGSALKRNNANENRKSSATNVSNATAIDEKNTAAEPTNKKNNQPVDQAVLRKSEVNDLVGFNFDKSVKQFPALNSGSPEIPPFNTVKNLKDATTISPYIMPGKLTWNRPAIHIPAAPRFYAGIFYSPTIPFSHLRDEDHNYGNSYSRELEKRESGTYSYSFGFSIGYRLNHKWSLQSGISLSTLNMHLEPEKIYAERDNRGRVKYPINTSSGKGYILPSFSNNPRIGDSLFTRNIKHSLIYTGIPLAIKYNVTFGRLSANLLAGLSANILSKGKISTEVKRGNESELEKTHEIHGLKPVYFNGLAGIGFDYNIYKNLSLTFSPIINFAIDPINENVPVRSYPGTIDFQFGLQMKF